MRQAMPRNGKLLQTKSEARWPPMKRNNKQGNNGSLATRPLTIALYMRVSSEDQAERSTIEGQRDFLRSYAELMGLVVAGEYADNGISGTIPLGQRPAGHQLLEDAKLGRFGTVLSYRVDRLGRSLSALLDAYNTLTGMGIVLRSATEPFDTSTPMGSFVFQLLGSLAELERSTIAGRMAMGRARVNRDGRWTNGPVPYGYELDADGRLCPSPTLCQRWV
jgi:site-specific DNA recombinase